MLESLSKRSQQFVAIFAALAIIGPAIWWLGGDKLQSTLSDFVNPNAAHCVRIPVNGHEIKSAAAGEWATVTWREIERTNDCGRPDIYGVLSNGDGIYHDVQLSTNGVNLKTGVTDELRYNFKIPQNVTAGRAWFRITLDFHQEGRTINSPRIYFIIEESE